VLTFSPSTRGALHVLMLGAHADDLEIGCGGTMLELLRRPRPLRVSWVVFSGVGRREQEARRSARHFLRGARRQEVIVERFRDGYFPTQHREIKDCFERLKARVRPDMIFTHARDDLHQDHRLISELTWNTFRDHAIFEYEIVKYDGGLGSPNAFVPVSAANCRRKITLLMREFGTQRSRRWFTPQTFMAMLRLRGVECNSPSGYAEGFHVRKLLL
jgi:LmbE family N-acetylglucosaminyl deacetylase